MPLDHLLHRVEMTRSVIDAKMTMPAVVHVAAAKVDDGSDTLATLLAYSFADNGVSTLLAGMFSTYEHGQRNRSSDPVSHVRATIAGAPDLFDIRELASTAGATDEFYSASRLRYDVTVTSSVVGESASLPLAIASDVAIIALRKGRSVKTSDHEFSRLLKEMQVPVLGVVFVDPELNDEVNEHPRKAFGSLNDKGPRISVVGIEAR